MRVTESYLSLTARIVAATVGGYAFATVAATLLGRILPLPQASAVMTGLLLSFLLYLLAVLWVFATRTAKRAWLGLLAPIALMAGLLWLLGTRSQ